MKTKSNKVNFPNFYSPFNLGEIATSETGADRSFMIKLIYQSFLLEAAMSSQNVICILRDYTDVFFQLAYPVNRTDMQCKVQVERWDRPVLNINAICADLGQKCFQV